MSRKMSERAAITVTVVGRPGTLSDAAVARFLERFLATERPGTTWTAQVSSDQRRAA
jgi:hypothetical protein